MFNYKKDTDRSNDMGNLFGSIVEYETIKLRDKIGEKLLKNQFNERLFSMLRDNDRYNQVGFILSKDRISELLGETGYLPTCSYCSFILSKDRISELLGETRYFAICSYCSFIIMEEPTNLFMEMNK